MKNLHVVTAKTETTYGVNASPTAGANVIVCQDVEMNPLEMETDDYAPVMPNFGQGEKIVGATWCTISGKVLLCGGGSPAGTLPNCAPLLRAFAMAQTVSVGVSVTYNLVSTGEESATVIAWNDGIKQPMVGLRGTGRLNFTAKKAPMLEWNAIGLNVPMVDEAMPAPTIPSIPRPVAVNKANTVVTIGGYQVRLSQLIVDLGAKPEYRNRTNREDVVISDRVVGGKAIFEMPLVAEKDFLGASGYCTLGTAAALSIVHGTAVGNIMTLSLPKVQLLKPKPKFEGGTLMLECDLHAARNGAGNDELVITFT
jgi:hypothetical protein